MTEISVVRSAMLTGENRAARSRPLLLVVDDDRSIRMLATRVLGSSVFDVRSANDGEDALLFISQELPDIILLDVEMPELDGISLCARLRADPRTRDIPICLMTGYGDAASIEKAYEAGASDFVVKPPIWLILQERLRYLYRSSVSERRLIAANRGLNLAGVVFENIPVSVAITNADGAIIGCNPAFNAMNGFLTDEVVGKHIGILDSSRQGSEFYDKLWQELRAHGSWQGEIWYRRKSSELYPALLAVASLRDGNGAISRFIWTAQDVSFAKESEERIRYLAFHDVLTGLPNRVHFRDRAELAMNLARRDRMKAVLVFLDLDEFKKVNDTLGHDVGDLLLVEVANRLSAHVRGDDTVARQGGDEFLILLSRVRDASAVLTLAEKILGVLAQPYSLLGHDVRVTASMGISVFPDDAATYEELLKSADIAMYRAKEAGKKGYTVFSQEMTERVVRRAALETRLRHAVSAGEISVHFQSRVDLWTGQIVGAEALLRWRSDGKLVNPTEFIPIAEESGLIVPLGEFVLEQSALLAASWIREGAHDFVVSVNVSPVQLCEPEFCASVEEILRRTKLPSGTLELEITEGIFVQNLDAIAATLHHLSALGVRVALDDFGTGYSSLYYLKKLPISVLKIDQSFVRDLDTSEDSRVIVQTILSMAHVLDITVVAEGVETESQRAYLRENCKGRSAQGQGYLFARPVPSDEFRDLLFDTGNGT